MRAATFAASVALTIGTVEPVVAAYTRQGVAAMRSGFNCNLLDLPANEHPTEDYYRPYFLNYRAEQWNRGSGGGSFLYFGPNDRRYGLIIMQDPTHGFSFKYDLWDTSRNRNINVWYSIGKRELMGSFHQTPDELLVPLGSFVQPANAWPVVADFIRDPTKRSTHVEWIEAGDLPWPDEA